MVNPFDIAWNIIKYDPDREAVAARNQARAEMGDNREPMTNAAREMQQQGITQCDMCRINTPQLNSFGMKLCKPCFDATFSQRNSPEQQALDRAERMREEQS